MPGFSFDVLVVGGGVIGASIAWRLARQRTRVMLLDVKSIGAEASSAAAGMLTPPSELESSSPMWEFALKSLAQYPDFVAELESDSHCSVDLRHSGAVEVAYTEDEFQSLAGRASSLRHYDVRSHILSGRQARELAPLLRDDVLGGIHYPDDLTVDPEALMKALSTACLDRGVFLVEGAPVVSLEANAEGVKASIPGRAFEGEFGVIAAGAWSQDISVSIDGQPHPTPASFPVKGHLVGYRLAAGSLGATVRHADTYVLQRAGGFTIAGSSIEKVAYDRSINQQIVADIRARATVLLPSLDGLEPERVWTGFRPATPTGRPEVGRIANSRIWLAYGHYRNGVLLAPATADRVSEDIRSVLSG